jgi:hypothetical protein
MAPTDDLAPRCPECGAALDSREGRCWLCRREVSGPEVNPYASPPAAALAAASPAQFSLVTLLLVITLVAVCLGVTMAAPGLGVLLMVLAAPALVRTMVAGVRQKQVGARMTTAEKMAAFCVSLLVMVMIGVAAVAAFEIACWGSCALAASVWGEGEPALMTGLVAGGVAGVAAIGWLLWLTRPRKPHAPSKAPPPPGP